MDFQNFDLNLLRIFDVIMSELNLTRAAERLAITQPAASNALKRLRVALGDELVTRAAFGVKPTPRAQELWPVVRNVLSELESLISPENFEIGTAHTTFRISSNDFIAALLMPFLIPIIECHAPGLKVRMIPIAARDPYLMLNRGEIDLAIGHFESFKSPFQERPRPLAIHVDHLAVLGNNVCVMSKNHPLSQKKITLDDYCSANHIVFTSSSSIIDEVLAKLGRTRRHQLTLNTFFTAANILDHSNLIATMPSSIVSLISLDNHLVTNKLPIDLPNFPIDMLWHERDVYNGALTWLRENVQKILQNTIAPQVCKPAFTFTQSDHF